MKKLIIITLFCLFGFSQMDAQVSFRPGIRGGLNFSHFTEGDFSDFNNYNEGYYDEYGNYFTSNDNSNYSSNTDFYLGVYGALKLSKAYTLQPEINYSRQGSKFEFRQPNAFIRKGKYEVSYLSLGVINKFTVKDFNIHLGPMIDFVVEENFHTENDVDFAFTLGLGYNFTKNLGIEARAKKGIITVLDNSNSHTNVVFQAGLTYTFDVK